MPMNNEERCCVHVVQTVKAEDDSKVDVSVDISSSTVHVRNK